MQSWIEGANLTGSQFPIQNLPYGVFRNAARQPHCCVAIGEEVLDLAVLEEARLIDLGAGESVFSSPSLNAFMALGPAAWRRLRLRVTELLMDGGDPSLRDDEAARARALYRQDRAEFLLPFEVSGYTDFYACQHHAANAGF